MKEEEESLSVSAVSTVSALCLIQFLLEFFFFFVAERLFMAHVCPEGMQEKVI